MRFLCGCILLLTVVAVLTNAKSTSEMNGPNIDSTGESVDAIPTGSTHRFLSIDGKEDEEERMFGVKLIPSIDKFSNYLKDQRLTKHLNKYDKDIDYIFSKLGLKMAGKKLFENQKFLIWVNYVDEYSTKRGKTVPMYPTLKRHYNDEELIKMLDAARQAESTKRIATKLQMQQMRVWEKNGLSLDYLFKTYKLDREYNPFKNPAINILGRYLDELNPGKKSLFEILQTRFSDSQLSQLLDAATQVQSTKNLASKLQTEQLEAWKRAGLSIDKLFRIYKLDDGVAPMLANPMLKHWMKYADEVNPGKKQHSLVLFGHITRIRHYLKW